MTLLKKAKDGTITKEMKEVARIENLDPEYIREGIAKGAIIIPKNKERNTDPTGIGKGLTTKINVNIGTSQDRENFGEELKKMQIAIRYGADAIMDLSTGSNINRLRQMMIKKSTIPVGTVPIYQTATKHEKITDMTKESMFEAIETHAKDGVDFITVHCGVTQKVLETLKNHPRTIGIVSRGGSFLARWMAHHRKENPYYEYYEELLGLARKYDLTLSLGDGLRPGCIADATDRSQVQELMTLGELAKRAYESDVQVMIEGPGHVPMDQIETNMRLEKSLCNNAPFYVLGPLVTDIAPGYDHITSAIGGAIAAANGADFLCYVTPSEHLALPTAEDVKQGVIAAKIAAHAADIAKGIQSAIERDRQMSEARKALDWKKQQELAIDPEAFGKYRKDKDHETCTMCGRFCSMKR
ncbi:MAG: phosphomethylpyrimidine synthase ThiC [archaeon]